MQGKTEKSSNMTIKRSLYPAGKYMFKVKYRNRHRFGVFIVSFGHISRLVLLFLLLTLSKAKEEGEKEALEHFKHVIKICPNRGHIFQSELRNT